MASTQDPMRRAGRDANPIIDLTARLGFAAKGIVTTIMGAFALRLATGQGSDLAGPEEALRTVLQQHFGQAALAVVSVGLWAHACWSLLQAVLDLERKGSSFTGVMERVGFGLTALAYFTLGMAGWQLLTGNHVGGARDPEE